MKGTKKRIKAPSYHVIRFIKFSLFPIVHQSLTGLSESQGSSLSKAVAAIISSIPEAISVSQQILVPQ